MKPPGKLMLLAGLIFLCESEPFVIDDEPGNLNLESLGKEVKTLRQALGALSRQVMLQQTFVEEKIRSDADSGVKQVRHAETGSRPYNTATHTSSRRVVSIHDHSNNIRTVGMGEFVGVLNGVEFRTRHNDYRLYMASKNSTDYHATDLIPFPDVPPEVSSKPNVSEQIEEMRKWFKAFADQDHSVRDYRKYFRPVLCYLEGAWTMPGKGDIDEPFESDRHFIDASSWFDLQDKVRFTAYTGRKDNLENFAFLPTTIINIINNTYPQFAQWNYRILCHPINRDLPLNRLRIVDDLGPRMTGRRTLEQHAKTRAARFQLNLLDRDQWREGINGAKWSLIDDIMSQIPGKDNRPGTLYDEAFGLPAFSMARGQSRQKLNTAFYHRWFKVGEKGAMGTSSRHRGYSDEKVFMAMTSQSKIAGMNLRTCKKIGKQKVCKDVTQRWTYAIPMEIIYLTPLYKWNPFDLHYKGEHRSALGKTVYAGGRNGGKTVDSAYDGINSKLFIQTPDAFFSGKEVDVDAADTTQGSLGVLDKTGQLRICRASGTRIFLPEIPGVGTIRTRYPILPVHGEGSQVGKELLATKDLLLKSKTYSYVFHEPLQSGPTPTLTPKKPVRLLLGFSTYQNVTRHQHEIIIDPAVVDQLKKGRRKRFTTSQAESHTHDIDLRWDKKIGRYKIVGCNSAPRSLKMIAKEGVACWDKHQWLAIEQPN